MALEKKWAAVPPRPLIANGTIDGQITLSDTRQFYVKQLILLTSGAQPTIEVQIKRIEGDVLYVGPVNGKITERTDISMYLLVDSPAVLAKEQLRPTISPEDSQRAVYEEEPVVAIRSLMVDDRGNAVGSTPDAPMYVALEGDVSLDTVKIWDGTDQLGVNADGSINVNIVNGSSSITSLSEYGEASSVPNGVATGIVAYVAAPGKTTFLQAVKVAGTNIARYQVKLNGIVIDTDYTYFGGPLSTRLEFAFSNQGLSLVEGDVVTVEVLHNRPTLGDFNARIQVVEV